MWDASHWVALKTIYLTSELKFHLPCQFLNCQTNGQTKAFHQMNLYWNSVNLLIARFSPD
ncbi:DUF6992 family protein [Algoriphagus sp. C2-6-M1]|uniref:DUF6992 family protein n=1 Tax=Algoriphagus persicinus TaxID=3108754 RepID=UPI003A5CD5BB